MRLNKAKKHMPLEIAERECLNTFMMTVEVAQKLISLAVTK